MVQYIREDMKGKKGEYKINKKFHLGVITKFLGLM